MHYKRNLSDLDQVQKNWYKVFSCFSCWGGSTMWYKLSWYDVIGICEIDKEMIKVYESNFKPKYKFNIGIQEMKKHDSIPEELFWIDILDWSPPCSTFSMSGIREKTWWKNKKFREWQAKQILSDLFFDYLDFAEVIKPKIIIAENVKGIISGNAKLYVKRISHRLKEMWYTLQIFLLNGATMWLPQKRERVFFLAYRNDLWPLPKLKLDFKEKPIMFHEISDNTDTKSNLSELYTKYRESAKEWQPVWKFMQQRKWQQYTVLNTITAKWAWFHPKYKRKINNKECMLAWSFPQDYNFDGIDPKYLIWMSVPPLMMWKISEQIRIQRLDLILKQK